jgi:hypothetical protein
MKSFLQALFSVKTARLVLDYLKVIAWPIVLLSALLFFSRDISDLLGRINEGSVGPGGVHFRGTGNPSPTPKKGNPSPAPSPSPDESSRPDVWFSIYTQPTGLRCGDRARKALEAGGFLPPNQNGDLTWGYQNEKIVSAIWCGAPNNSVLITVAGAPVTELEPRLKQLENSFFNANQ